MQPEVRFARLGADRIAYEVLGDGPIDLVVTPGMFGAMDVEWEDPEFAMFLRQMCSFCRLIRFDRRGSGASDPVPVDALPPWESSLEELLAVMDAVGSDRAAILALMDAGPVAMLAAATRPARVSALILLHAAARHLRDIDYPFGPPTEAIDEIVAGATEAWGTESMVWQAVPSRAADERFRRWFAKYMRAQATPRAVEAFIRAMVGSDARSLLPAIHVPTLVLHAVDYAAVPLPHGRYLAEHIEGARLVEMPGADGPPIWQNRELFLQSVRDFLLGAHPGSTPAVLLDRAMATVMFTDIESSTERSRAIGDRAWRDLLDIHDDVCGRRVREFGGRLIKATGDGILATFEGPGRAIRCASSLRDDLQHVGLPIRAGVHAGEVELRGDDIGGVVVHIAARVMAAAAGGEVLVSRTVHDLVVGSEIVFAARGAHSLKGIEGEWELFAVASG